MSPREARAHACALAQEAVQLLREGAGQAHAVHHKAPGDWTSELDLRIEDHLRQRIAKTFPNHVVSAKKVMRMAPTRTLCGW
jgi:fructose-1,6-bisphosphatase/inositol monophosphatase family enzyme|nr:inositol monophosphatase family protein [Curvibacter delicatus]